MDAPEQSQPPSLPRKSRVSAEAIIGSGMTVAALGVLCLLLGWAQWMRLEREYAMIWLPLGAVMVVGGAITAVVGRGRSAR